VQTGYLKPWWETSLTSTPTPPSVPLQPHPSIMDIPEPPIQPANDGWDNNLVNPPSDIAQWPISPRDPPLPHHTMPFVTSTASVAHSPPREHRVPSHEIQIDKGKRPIVTPSTDTSQSSSVHSKKSQQRKKVVRGKLPSVTCIQS
jgi:hypothetical protein